MAEREPMWAKYEVRVVNNELRLACKDPGCCPPPGGPLPINFSYGMSLDALLEIASKHETAAIIDGRHK